MWKPPIYIYGAKVYEMGPLNFTVCVCVGGGVFIT